LSNLHAGASSTITLLVHVFLVNGLQTFKFSVCRSSYEISTCTVHVALLPSLKAHLGASYFRGCSHGTLYFSFFSICCSFLCGLPENILPKNKQLILDL